MKQVVFSKQISKKEKLSKRNFEIILRACKKGLLTKIKGKDLPKASSLVKIYVTTIEGARRLVLVLDEKINVGYFLFFRKKDDRIGENISIKNPEFKKVLQQYLQFLDEDMEDGNFEIIKL